jgi:ferric-dicitrate binding protein FerR (iron transport regulator)
MKNMEKHGEDLKKWERLASEISGESTPDKRYGGDLQDADLSRTIESWKSFDMMRKEDNETDVDSAWQSLYARLEKDRLIPGKREPRIFTPFLSGLMRIAASILIVTGVGYATFRLITTPEDKMVTVASGNEKNITITLPDGSNVTLNRYSSLTYPVEFSGETKTVELTGEGFFEIIHDPSTPFRVKAGNAGVEVLGTSFNVNSPGAGNEVEVFVKTGRVMLTIEGENEKVILNEGDIGNTGTGKPVRYTNTNPNYLAWNSGILVYESATLQTVFADLKRVYGINIIADQSLASEKMITTVFDNTPEEEIIKIISATFNLSWRKEGIDYIFSQQ